MKGIRAKLDRLSVFDKLLFFLAVIAIVFFGFVFFRKTSHVTVTIKVGENSVSPWGFGRGARTWFAYQFHEGMIEKGGLGRTMAEVLSVHSYDTSPTTRAVYLNLKLRAVFSRTTESYTFKGRPVLIGSPVKLNLGDLFVEGLVTHVEGVEDPRERRTVIVESVMVEETPVFEETRGVRDYVADALKVGDEIKDNQGNIVIKVLDKQTTPAKKTVTTSDGRVFVQTHPLRKDVNLTLEVEALKIHGRYYLFDDVPIVIGVGIPIHSPTLTVFPEVTDMTEVD